MTRMMCPSLSPTSHSPSPPRGEGRGEGDALRDAAGNAGTIRSSGIHASLPPHPNPLPALSGPSVRLPRQRKLRLRESRGERGQVTSREVP
ncbi:protein of unknown function (plasmid) [Azospirillum lipoferum 4B]|uniref:Uncharacterized protein n=1 Tax=Azospirillum lipoferum (strain 4B) TaxID=862719 RepID=G7ZCN2_AZOL4|nr:protein of unknown function [Azospirillum lipoferum 4B]